VLDTITDRFGVLDVLVTPTIREHDRDWHKEDIA
jgi:hypothetical protein